MVDDNDNDFLRINRVRFFLVCACACFRYRSRKCIFGEIYTDRYMLDVRRRRFVPYLLNHLHTIKTRSSTRASQQTTYAHDVVDDDDDDTSSNKRENVYAFSVDEGPSSFEVYGCLAVHVVAFCYTYTT